MSQVRFPVLTPEQMTPRQKEVAALIADGPRGGIRGPFAALLHSPELANVVQQVGEYLRFKSTIPPALIELTILVVARHWTSQNEWYAHERVERTKTYLPYHIIVSIQRGEIPHNMTDEQLMVHDFAVGAFKYGAPSGAVFDEVVARFGRPGALDLLALCGYYTMVAMILNTAQVPIPDGGTPPLRERL